MATTMRDWRVLALSVAGIFFIMLGLVILALPSDQEGDILWQLDPEHAVRWMDMAGAFLTGLGVMLTWVGGLLWQRQMRA
jgi:drug/metabolite transporter (DMT)-like permease